MKFRQKFAAVLAAIMLATSMPVFAQSINGVNKEVTVAQGAELEDASLAPELKIELKDDLDKNDTFFLNLENAEWSTQAAVNMAKIAELGDFDFTLVNSKQLGVTPNKDIAVSRDAVTEYKIPMFTKVTGGEAKVTIDPKGSTLTRGTYTFAKTNATSGIVTANDAKDFVTTGTMANITIEESHIGAFNNATRKQKVRFELEGSGFEFDYNTDTVLTDKLVGAIAYQGKTFPVTVIDATTLEATIDADALKSAKMGTLTLKDIKIRAAKDAAYGDVNVIVSGDLNDSTKVLVAKYGDYNTELKVSKEYTVVAGQKLTDIEFTLSETVADSLRGNRETTFSFPEGVTIESVSVSRSEGLTDGAAAPTADIIKKGTANTNQFKVESIAANSKVKTAVTFRATVNVPASFDKDLALTADGKSLDGIKEVKVATVTAPATIEITPAILEVGAAKQAGGKVVIAETEKGNLSAGKIFLAIDDSDFNYTAAPDVTVTEGNLKVNSKAKIVKGGLEITVTSKSTTLSTLEISGGELKVNGYVPEGTYTVKVGGPALSAHSADALWNVEKMQYENIDTMVEKDFILLGAKEDPNAPKKSAFVIGQATYTVNGEEKTMDTAAYVSAGRTMLPVRYVADALGVDANQIMWDKDNKTVTILADRVVQIKLGSKSMTINGALVSMTAAAEMKNDRVFIPVAEIARALGATVAWDEVTKTATFN